MSNRGGLSRSRIACDWAGSRRPVAWLRALEGDQSFILTGIGFDWLEGRFRSVIRDVDALARRF